MSKKHDLDNAIKQAKRIRRNLLRLCHPHSDEKLYKFPHGLAGACGLASILLAIDLNDVSILRGKAGHAWVVVSGHIIDITATQFNHVGTYNCKPIKGVLVTKTPRAFYKPVEHSGMDTYLAVVNQNWYTNDDYGKWQQVADYWL